jgi:hypothetical protein
MKKAALPKTVLTAIVLALATSFLPGSAALSPGPW